MTPIPHNRLILELEKTALRWICWTITHLAQISSIRLNFGFSTTVVHLRATLPFPSDFSQWESLKWVAAVIYYLTLNSHILRYNVKGLGISQKRWQKYFHNPYEINWNHCALQCLAFLDHDWHWGKRGLPFSLWHCALNIRFPNTHLLGGKCSKLLCRFILPTLAMAMLQMDFSPTLCKSMEKFSQFSLGFYIFA